MREIKIPANVVLKSLGPDSPDIDYSFEAWCGEFIINSPEATAPEGLEVALALGDEFDAGHDPITLLPSAWDKGREMAKASIGRVQTNGKTPGRWMTKILKFYQVWCSATKAT